jgi:transposase
MRTGVYVNGTCLWMHVCSTQRLTHYALHPKRSTAALDAIGISPHFHGISVHDGWPMYHRYFHQHTLCNVHHLRELTFVEEELGQPWAARMKRVLLEMKEAVEQASVCGKSSLDVFSVGLLRARYREILLQGEQANPPDPPPKTPKKGRVKHTLAQNLLRRLHTYQDEVLLFLENFAVDFDNNLAERDVRMAKVQQKISGCFRSEKGAAAFARIRGYLSTMRKQGWVSCVDRVGAHAGWSSPSSRFCLTLLNSYYHFVIWEIPQ